MPDTMQPTPFETGTTCWRETRVDCFELVVDGADYFRALRQALLAAKRQVLLIGWDFDLEIEMQPGDSDENGDAPDGYPNRLGAFLEAVVERQPELQVYILRWTGSAIIAEGALAPVVRMKLSGPDRIHMALDGRHPVGACHHQKIVVVDDCFAFCGGIDATDARWDTREHRPDDPRRVLRDGSPAKPWHDVTTALTGPVARDLGDLARLRWTRATGQDLDRSEGAEGAIWPDSLPVSCRDMPAAISRTEPPESDAPLVNEIEELILRSIASASRLIYLESQYFACDEVAGALKRRLQEPDGPEVIVLNPNTANKFVEDQAMHITRARLVKEIAAADPHGRFRIWTPVNAAEEPIYVHAKVCIIDDWLMRVGSSNLNRRSMGFDTECDLAIQAKSDSDRTVIAEFRNRLLAEHLNTDPETVAKALENAPSVIAAIERLNPPSGRGLRRLEEREDEGLGAVLADTRALDPRFDRGTDRRKGVTARHLMIGGAILAAIFIWALVG